MRCHFEFFPTERSDPVRKLILALCALIIVQCPALAVTVIAPNDTADSLEAAQTAARDKELGHYGMTPIPGSMIADGDYAVEIQSTSPFFKIREAVLHVAGGELSADILIGSDSYDLVRMDEEISGERTADGTVFHIPVPALNMPFDCAAHSVKRDQWYDRRLLVDAASLPKGALSFELPNYELLEKALLAYGDTAAAAESAAGAVEPVAVDLADGEYAIEVSLSGGSGRADVSSPTILLVREGKAWARLLWSSAYYDYMLVGGVRYDNLSEGGNSSFEIPIAAMDQPVTVVADTTAMGDPVEIEYQLTFYAESIGDRNDVPQEAAKQVLAISLAIIILGGILNHFVKKARARG